MKNFLGKQYQKLFLLYTLITQGILHTGFSLDNSLTRKKIFFPYFLFEKFANLRMKNQNFS